MEMPVVAENYLFQTVMTFSRNMDYARDEDGTLQFGVLDEVLVFIKQSITARFKSDEDIEIDATWRILNDYKTVAYDIFVTETARSVGGTNTYHNLHAVFTETSLMFEGFDEECSVEELDTYMTGIWIACTACRGRGYTTHYSNGGRYEETVTCPKCQDMYGNVLSQTNDTSVDFYSLRNRVMNKKSIFATT
jgi:hypothetical protein